jgi:hypothetical protein
MAIQGLKLSMSSDELKATMLKRIEYHQEKADWLNTELKRLEPELAKFGDDAQAQGKFSTSNRIGGVAENFKQEYARHTDKVTLFKFMSEHVIANETYILDENDLRKLEVLPNW